MWSKDRFSSYSHKSYRLLITYISMKWQVLYRLISPIRFLDCIMHIQSLLRSLSLSLWIAITLRSDALFEWFFICLFFRHRTQESREIVRKSANHLRLHLNIRERYEWPRCHASWFRIRFKCNESSLFSKQKISRPQSYQWSSEDSYNDSYISRRNPGFSLTLLYHYSSETIISSRIIFSSASFAQLQISISSFCR